MLGERDSRMAGDRARWWRGSWLDKGSKNKTAVTEQQVIEDQQFCDEQQYIDEKQLCEEQHFCEEGQHSDGNFR